MFTVILLCFLHATESFEEPQYVVNMDSPLYVYGDGSEKYISTSDIMVEKHNESCAFMHGEMDFLLELEKPMVEMVLLKESSGKYEAVFTHDICDLCKELGDDGSDYKKYLKYFGIPTTCPIEPGRYKILNFVVNTDDLEINDQLLGTYELNLNVFAKTGDSCQNDRDLLFILKIDLSIEKL